MLSDGFFSITPALPLPFRDFFVFCPNFHTCMDSQPKPQFVESALKECCSADCSSCPTFPAPFRRIGDSSYCRFSRNSCSPPEGVTFPADRTVRILFILSGSLRIPNATPIPCAWLPRNSASAWPGTNRSSLRPRTPETRVVALSLILRVEFCGQDLLDPNVEYGSEIPVEELPMLSMHPFIEQLLSSCFLLPQISDCVRYHRMKATELFMMIKVLYTPTEHAYFFQTMIQPRDNFRVFVCNNYDKAQSVAELAALAGMSLGLQTPVRRTFQRQRLPLDAAAKARKILADIRDGGQHQGPDGGKYGFRHYTQFSRFCKKLPQATPPS